MAEEKFVLKAEVDDSGLLDMDKSARKATDSLAALVKQVRRVEDSTTGTSFLQSYGLSDSESKRLSATATGVKKMTDAVASFTRAGRALQGVDIAGAVAAQEQAFAGLAKRVGQMQILSKEQAAGVRRTADAYLALARAQDVATQTSIKFAESQARIKAQQDRLALDARKVEAGAALAARKQAASEEAAATKASLAQQVEDRRRYTAEVAAQESEARTKIAASREARLSAESATRQQAAAMRAAALAAEEEARALERTRYAARDLAFTYATLAAGAAALPVASVRSYSEQERAFADVKRTTEASYLALESLREAYRDFSQESSNLSFADLSEIGTLGAQMNIATSELDDFTAATAKFVTVTGETPKVAAENFGRIEQMLGGLQESSEGAGDGFEILASQVAELGAKSVATESEILRMTTSIATQAHQAGLSQSEILALSSTLSSLAVPKEWARGSIQRIFGKVNLAVAESDESLGAMAQRLGLTADQFKQMWQDNPNQLFFTLAQSISNITDKAERFAAVRDLGFTSVRDVELLARLSQNTGLWAAQLQIANASQQDASFLNDANAVILETLSSKYERLMNTAANTGAVIGESFGLPLKGALDIARGFLTIVQEIPQPLLAMAGGATTAVTAILGIKAAQASLIAFSGSIANVRRHMYELSGTASLSWGAVRTSLQTAMNASVQTGVATRAVTSETAKATVATKAYAASLNSASGAASVMSVKNSALVTSLRGVAASATQATSATIANNARLSAIRTGISGVAGAAGRALAPLAGFGRALSGLAGGPGGLILTGVLTVVPGLISWMTKEASEAARTMEELKSSMSGTSFVDAVLQDTKDAQSGLQSSTNEFKVAVAGLDSSLESSASTMYYWVDATGNVVAATEEVARKMQYSTLQIGENTRALLINAIKGTSAWQELDKQQVADLITNYGFDFGKLMSASMSDTSGEAATAYIEGFVATLETKKAAAINRVTSAVGTSVPGALHDALSNDTELQSLMQAISFAHGDLSKLKFDIQSLATTSFVENLAFGSAATEEFGSTAGEAAEHTGELSSAVDDLDSKIKGVSDSLFAAENAAISTANALSALYESIVTNGTTLDLDTPEGRANFEAVQRYFTSLTDEVVANAEAQGWTLAETRANVDATLSEAIAFLEAQGLDMTKFYEYKAQVDQTLGAPVVTGGVDDSALVTGLNSAVQKSAEAANQIQSNVNSAGVSFQGGGQSIRQSKPKTAGRTFWGGVPPRVAEAKERARSLFNPRLFAPSSSGGRHGGGGGGGGSPRSSSGAHAAKSAAEIFEDFLGRLNTAMKKSVDKWWSSTVAQDNYRKNLNSMRKDIEETTKKINDLRRENEKLTSDLLEDEKNLRDAQYFQGIAKKYGDKMRVQDTEVDISKASEAIKEKKAKIAANEQEAATLQAGQYALTGYSEAAIKNREALRSLQQTMIGLIESYAASGASTHQVQAYTERLKQEFINQATQMGFNRAEVARLAGAFDGLRNTIGTVPRNVNVNVSDGGSIGRLQGRINGLGGTAYVNWQGNSAGALSDLQRQADRTPIRVNFFGYDPYTGDEIRRGGRIPRGYAYGGHVQGFASGGLIPGRPPSNPRKDNLMAQTENGFIKVRSREFIMQESAVKQYGVQFLHAINKGALQLPAPVVVQQPAPEVVTLNPAQVAQIVNAVRTVVSLDGKVVGDSLNNAYRADALRGRY